jgi:hypothetical protein
MKLFLANQSGTPVQAEATFPQQSEPGHTLQTEKTTPEGDIAPLPAFFSKAPS